MAIKKRPARPWTPPARFLVNELEWTTRPGTMPDAHGQCVLASNTILISDDIAPAVVPEVWLHELLHAIWSYTLKGSGFTDDQEEQVISALAPGLYAALKRNGLAFGD